LRTGTRTTSPDHRPDIRVGQIVDCVEQAGIADHTVIVFSSDNATASAPARNSTATGPRFR
jgi:arylsulfatase A-like enzyme